MVSEQRYTDPRALARMAEGLCPECGHAPSRHDGWGGPAGCGLTDHGVAARIAAYRDHPAPVRHTWHGAPTHVWLLAEDGASATLRTPTDVVLMHVRRYVVAGRARWRVWWAEGVPIAEDLASRDAAQAAGDAELHRTREART